ncbi:hypothetical protein ABB37_01478 [Leptomonas pyrrhocoris]|uniref:Uncharacterized protein n=1 Tax=Leptomonas pyrrhocoris TaxID=157538 RepID=A0A0M9G8M7_LEPPY|nr:hypothetical protein ABB37_01478 [Leptomonas pyrrhocoris]XP_015663500.1 hypothetical protein ABB37_01478 [Leptomonas pyrrhocoris]KPA85060.1 hypothetical protein ABB37_01478 [Leptomonas pyrrhocoris]KPA85061.1 hypothetical protein ABB37_01478 [Leptomonas pyrrhocoris]|eukprot:XP_015663499.1 hypothetical protein ABB37_01478 [Leptomonas pyrrhocoris]
MGRVAKRSRAEAPPSMSQDHPTPSTPPAAKSQPAQKRCITPPKRVESKKFVPELDDLVDTDAASVHSDDSVRVENSQEREDALVAAGGELTGDALREFLQANFVDYIDEKLFDIANLDALGT